MIVNQPRRASQALSSHLGFHRFIRVLRVGRGEEEGAKAMELDEILNLVYHITCMKSVSIRWAM